MEKRLTKLEERIATIEERNRSVELNKGWETSLTRRLAITVVTYFAALLYLLLIGEKRAPLIAAVPTGAYILSAISLPLMRHYWERKRRHNR